MANSTSKRPPDEYVEVHGQLFADTEALLPWLQRSLAYAKTLKPK